MLDEKDLINLANSGINDTLKDTLNDTLNDTLKLLKNNPKLRQKEIAEQLEISEITVKRNIKELKERGYIERIGARKSGYWKVSISGYLLEK